MQLRDMRSDSLWWLQFCPLPRQRAAGSGRAVDSRWRQEENVKTVKTDDL